MKETVITDCMCKNNNAVCVCVFSEKCPFQQSESNLQIINHEFIHYKFATKLDKSFNSERIQK